MLSGNYGTWYTAGHFLPKSTVGFVKRFHEKRFHEKVARAHPHGRRYQSRRGDRGHAGLRADERPARGALLPRRQQRLHLDL